MMLIVGILAGVKHMSNMALLRADEAIRSIFDWEKFPVDSSLGRIIKLFSHSSCNELSEVEAQSRRKVWKNRWFGRVTMEFDSSVKGVYGSQEGAAVGYNPGARGRKSYHPIFCFLAENRECLHNWFRSGDAYTANGIVHFAKECFARLPKGIWKTFVRADSGFFDGKFIDFLESKGSLYLIKAKRTPKLMTHLEGQKWRKIKNDFESAEFEYQCCDWSRPRRFVAVRKLLEIKTEGRIFPEYNYDYFCYVCNDKSLTPWQAHKQYGKRGDSENWIQWAKDQMVAGTVLTQDFWANSALFQISVLAYNLMVWMMWLKEGRRLSQEPNTIRCLLIKVPARLLTGGRQLILKLSKNSFIKNRWLELEIFLEHLCFS